MCRDAKTFYLATVEKCSSCRARPRCGIEEVDDGIWLASFMHYDLGYFDLEQKTLQPLDNPFGTRLSPMSWVRLVTDVSGLGRLDTGKDGSERGTRTPDPRIMIPVL